MHVVCLNFLSGKITRLSAGSAPWGAPRRRVGFQNILRSNPQWGSWSPFGLTYGHPGRQLIPLA